MRHQVVERTPTPRVGRDGTERRPETRSDRALGGQVSLGAAGGGSMEPGPDRVPGVQTDKRTWRWEQCRLSEGTSAMSDARTLARHHHPTSTFALGLGFGATHLWVWTNVQ